MILKKIKCNLCYSEKTKKKIKITSRDRFEIASGINKKNFYRHWYKCNNCEALFNVHKNNNEKKLKKISKKYFKIDFPNVTPLQRFKRIINLSNKKSDNFYRVKRIVKFLSTKKKKLKLLDFGAGLGIFLYELIKTNFKGKKNWNFFSFETDKSNKIMLNQIKGITDINHNIFKKKKKFDFITLNKVLEHINKPSKFLKNIRNILNKNGIIYIEVPHISGVNRKNNNSLVSLHYNIYSTISLKLIASKLNLKILKIKIINEPSSKKTIYAFMRIKTNV